MIKVLIELHPFGDPDEKEILHNLYIGNVGTADGGSRKYYAWLDPKEIAFRDKPDAIISHYRQDGALELVTQVLETLRTTRKSNDDNAS